MFELETQRLHLRPFTADDVDDLAPIYADAEVMRFIGSGKPRNREETLSWLAGMLRHWEKHGFGMWATIDKGTNVLIGRSGLCFLDNTGEVEVGYLLAKAYWGKGLATEAAAAGLRFGFEELRLGRIVAVAQHANRASRRVLEKIGMQYEKDARYYQTDVAYYAIARKG